jgi:hypothetical protein
MLDPEKDKNYWDYLNNMLDPENDNTPVTVRNIGNI